MAPSIGTDSQELKPLIHELDLVDEIGELGKDLVALHGINISMLSGELNAYMTALRVEELDIDKVEVTLENMKHLNNVKEYSVTKVNLKEIGSVSSTVTITAWTVAVLIVLLVIATCCKCCAPCQTVGTAVLDLLKCLFGGLWSLCKCLIRREKSQPSGVKQNKRKLVEQPSVRKRFRKGHRNMGLDESVSASKASMDSGHGQ